MNPLPHLSLAFDNASSAFRTVSSYSPQIVSFCNGYTISNLYRNQKAYISGFQEYSTALFSYIQFSLIVPQVTAALLTNYPRTLRIVSLANWILFPGTIVFCAANMASPRVWAVTSGAINALVIHPLRRIFPALNFLSPERSHANYRISKFCNDHFGTLFQVMNIAFVCFGIYKKDSNAKASLAGMLLSYSTQIPLFSATIDHYLHRAFETFNTCAGLVSPSLFIRAFSTLSIVYNLFLSRIQSWTTPSLPNRLQGSASQGLLTAPSQVENGAKIAASSEVSAPTPFNIKNFKTFNLLVNPTHISRPPTLNHELSAELRAIQIPALLTIWDELVWDHKDILNLQLALEKDAAFCAQANLDEKTVIADLHDPVRCKAQVVWNLYTPEEILAYMRNRLNSFVLVMTGQIKTTGDMGDIEELKTDTKTIIRELQSYQDPIHKKGTLVNLIIDTGTYCADGVRKGVKNIVSNCIPLPADTSSIQQIVDTAFSAHRDALINMSAREIVRQMGRAPNDIHNIQLVRGVLERGFWHNPRRNADQLPDSFNFFINTLTSFQGPKKLWNHYSPAILLTLFKDLIREGKIEKEYIMEFPERLMRNEAVRALPQEQQDAFFEYLTDLWMEDAEIIPIDTSTNASLTVNPKILLAILVELGYLSPKPEAAPQQIANIEASISLFNTIDAHAEHLDHALSPLEARHLKLHFLHKYLLAPAQSELTEQGYQQLVSVICDLTQQPIYQLTSIHALNFTTEIPPVRDSRAFISANPRLQQICLRIENNLVMEGLVR